MATSIDRYYTENFKILTDYNEQNNAPLLNENIRESIHKVTEEESILDTNNVTADTFSHTPNTQIENENTIFTSKKLDKSDELVDILNYLTINEAKYYESDTAIASDSQGDPTHDPETVTHNSNRNEKVTHTSNRSFGHKLLSDRTIPVVVTKIDPSIDQRIATIFVVPQTLLMPVTKEVVMDAACRGAWVNRTPWLVIRNGINGSTPGNILNSVSVKHAPSPVLIGIVSTLPPCGLSGSLQIANKRQSMSPDLGINTQKLDAVVDRNFPNDLDYASIFRKVISHKLSDGSSDEIYSRYRVNFAGDVVQTQTPQFMYLGLLAINTLDESSVLDTPTNSI